MFRAEFHPSFLKDLKRLPTPLIRKLEETVEKIKENPEIGEKLLGDLNGYYSYHLRYAGIEYRLGYKIYDEGVYFLMFKTRENYYEMLKNRL